MGTARFALINAVPVSASCAEAITASIILQSDSMAPLEGGGGSVAFMGSFGLEDRKKYPAAFDRDLGLLR